MRNRYERVLKSLGVEPGQDWKLLDFATLSITETLLLTET